MTMKEATDDRIERIFRDLNDLIQHGQFTQLQIEFMEAYLDRALGATRKVKARIKAKEEA